MSEGSIDETILGIRRNNIDYNLQEQGTHHEVWETAVLSRSCTCHDLKVNQRSYSYAKILISATSLRDLNEVTPSGGRRSRKQ